MTLLAIETATDRMGVALVEDQVVRASYELLAERPHAVELPQAVQRVLQAAGQTLEQLDGFAVDIGPGSFTGLRIGLAFVKALAFQSGKPVVGVASLEVLAAGVPYVPQVVCPILDARRQNVYAARYAMRSGSLVKHADPALLPLETLLQQLQPLEGDILFLGDGVACYREALTQRLGQRAVFAPPELWLPNAATLGRLGAQRLQAGSSDDPRRLVPLYLYARDSSVNPTMRVSVPTPEIRVTSA